MITKSEGFKNRQKDIGWGYAIAHIVPFVGLYYAITRRTITPLLFAFLRQFCSWIYLWSFYRNNKSKL